MNREKYTIEDWRTDGRFKAVESQEIQKEIYEKMMNALPPFRLPRYKAEEIRNKYGIQINAGFLMPEPFCSDTDGFLFMAFGTCGRKYYYLGMSKNEGCSYGEDFGN